MDRSDLNLAKRLHRFTDASSDEMKRIFSHEGKWMTEICQACIKVHQSCELCALTGNLITRPNISISHVNVELNDLQQADFLTVLIRVERNELLNIVDTRTLYGERAIDPNLNGETLMNIIASEWTFHYGPPRAFGADPKFCKGFLKLFLQTHAITLRTRPSRSSYNNGAGEWNNGVFKNMRHSWPICFTDRLRWVI